MADQNHLKTDDHLGQGRRPERDGEIMTCGIAILVGLVLVALLDLVRSVLAFR